MSFDPLCANLNTCADALINSEGCNVQISVHHSFGTVVDDQLPRSRFRTILNPVGPERGGAQNPPETAKSHKQNLATGVEEYAEPSAVAAGIKKQPESPAIAARLKKQPKSSATASRRKEQPQSATAAAGLEESG